MINPSQSSSPSPSLLAPLTSRAIFREAVEYGATRYAETKYQHQSNILTYQPGDGMVCHGWFNRGFAEKFARSARRASKRIQFVVKKKSDVHYIGDVVLVNKYKGQTRFDAYLENRKYQLLHMTGTVDEFNKTLEVYNIGIARTEYLKNQSSRVVRPASPDLFNQNPNDLEMVIDDDNATRIIIVTQISRFRDKITVWACTPTSIYDADSGIIQLAEVEKICERPITNKRPSVDVTPKPETEKQVDHGIVVTPKKSA
jgi:hypothetical protein